MELDYFTGWGMIKKAKERQDENKMWLLYANMYPNFTKKTFIKFEDFYKKSRSEVSNKATEQILQDVEEIRKKFKKD